MLNNLISICSSIGSIFLVLWGLGGLLSILHYRLFGFIGGILFFVAGISLFQSPNILSKYLGSLFREVYFDTAAVHKQRLFAITLIIMALVMMVLPPSDLSVGLIGLTFGGWSFISIIIWLKIVKDLEKQNIVIIQTLKFKAYFVLICSIIFMFGSFMLITKATKHVAIGARSIVTYDWDANGNKVARRKGN